VSTGFDTLIYTDCAPGQGLRGTPGLQFQARSAGADEAAMSLVRQHLLYEAPDSWMRQRRPVSAYPPSLSHVCTNRYVATSAGVYLGREANGAREGNQLTHSIITRTPESYGLVRPAQLFQAPFWVAQPASTTECPPLSPGWRPGPFDVRRAQEMVRRHPDGDALLLALLSALQSCLGRGAKRVLFVSADCAEVLRWLATATFLIPQRIAVRLGFKVFTTDPATAIQPVLAVHPDWAGAAADINNDRGYIVFDLVNQAWTPVEPTSTARRWVRLFRSEDPYDVMDAVEVAAAADPTDADIAWHVAMTAVLHRPPSNETDARKVLEWLRRGREELVEAYSTTMMDLLLRSAGEWSPQLVAELIEVAGSRGLMDRPWIRLALLTMLIDQADEQVQLPRAVSGQPAPPDWHPDDQATAMRLVHEALQSAGPARFDALLRIAGLFRVPVVLSDVAGAAHHFVVDWADHPSRPHQPQSWPCQAELLSLLCDELDRRILAEEGVAGELGDVWLGDVWGDLFMSYPLPADRPIGRAVLTARMLRLSLEDRAAFVADCVRQALSAADGGQLLASTVAALWAVAPPEASEARALLKIVPAQVSLPADVVPDLAQRMVVDSAHASSRLEAAHRLVEAGFLVPDQELSALLAQDDAISSACEAFRYHAGSLPGPAGILGKIPERLLSARFDKIVDSLLTVTYPPVAFAALEQQPRLAGRYYARLSTVVRNPGRPEQAVAAFYLANRQGDGPLPSRPIRENLGKGVRDWLKRQPDERVVDAAEALVRGLGDGWLLKWRALRTKERTSHGIARLNPFGRGRR
jgi:hypothetical protein